MKRNLIAKIAAALAAVCLLACVSACSGGRVLPRPQDTDLQFWVAEKVSDADLAGLQFLPGMFGGAQYLGSGYAAPEGEEPPHSSVVYKVTAYPDYSSNDGAFDTVTGILVTDPAVRVGGITCTASLEEFESVFRALGCSVERVAGGSRAVYGKTSISLFGEGEQRELRISVEVTNKEGIVF